MVVSQEGNKNIPSGYMTTKLIVHGTIDSLSTDPVGRNGIFSDNLIFQKSAVEENMVLVTFFFKSVLEK